MPKALAAVIVLAAAAVLVMLLVIYRSTAPPVEPRTNASVAPQISTESSTSVVPNQNTTSVGPSSTAVTTITQSNQTSVNSSATATTSASATQTSGGCVVLTWTGPSQYPTASVGGYIMQINMWNIKSASGTATMRYCDGVFYYEQALKDIAEADPNAWVAGYPEIWLGYKPWAGAASPNSPFPIKISAAESSNFTISVEYSVEVPDPTLPFDFAFDLWVTKSTGERSVGQGEQEIMIWLYYQQLIPAGEKVGEVRIPLVVNGSPVEAVFHVYRKEGMPWEYIAFVLSKPMRSGSVSFRLADFIRAAAAYTALSNYPDMWLNDVELGSEFGSPFTTEAAFRWTLKMRWSG
ncbi:MAG: GH12 family glycosyl hydrolase domain-containing protein [Thermoproteus sp.]